MQQTDVQDSSLLNLQYIGEGTKHTFTQVCVTSVLTDVERWSMCQIKAESPLYTAPLMQFFLDRPLIVTAAQ